MEALEKAQAEDGRWNEEREKLKAALRRARGWVARSSPASFGARLIRAALRAAVADGIQRISNLGDCLIWREAGRRILTSDD